MRDYETMKIEQDISNEFVLVLDEGDGVSDAPVGGRRCMSGERVQHTTKAWSGRLC